MEQLLLLTVYFLVVLYVLYQMALSLENQLEDKVSISLDRDFTVEQTQSQLMQQPIAAKGIKASVKDITFGLGPRTFKRTSFLLSFAASDKLPEDNPELNALRAMGMSDAELLAALETSISIHVSPTGKQRMRQLFFLSVEIKNGTSDRQLYINWDSSSLTVSGQGSRIIRSTPNMPVDLSQPQVFTVVNPGQSFMSNITTEKNYVRDPETNRVEMPRPLVDLADQFKFLQMSKEKEKGPSEFALYGLDLMVGVKHVTEHQSQLVNLLVPFGFTLDILPGQIALPILRPVMRRLGRRSRQNA